MYDVQQASVEGSQILKDLTARLTAMLASEVKSVIQINASITFVDTLSREYLNGVLRFLPEISFINGATILSDAASYGKSEEDLKLYENAESELTFMWVHGDSMAVDMSMHLDGTYSYYARHNGTHCGIDSCTPDRVDLGLLKVLMHDKIKDTAS